MSDSKQPIESKDSEQAHKIRLFDVCEYRLSIDINAIKEHTFRGVIYAKYSQLHSLGIGQQFKTSPPIEITKPQVEMQFPSSFASYTFDASKSQLTENLGETTLQVEVWHQDRMKKDELIGISFIQLSNLLQSPVRKTAQSYVRVYDAYFPLDDVITNETTGQREPKQRIGSLRVIFYLEDLGPTDMLNQNERQVQDHLFMNAGFGENDPGVPSLLPFNKDDPDKQKLIFDMNSLEHKVIWELETWRKSEEAKFRIQLKQREYDFLQQLAGEQKTKEYDRERIFKQQIAQIQLIETKMKQKCVDLQRREQRILLMEEELKTKLQETAKVVREKDEEQGRLIKKFKDEKLQYEKDKTLSSLKLTDAQGMIQKLQDDVKRLVKEMENSPIAIVKGDLMKKGQEITDLRKEIDKINQIKEQYKQYYEKVRDELIRQKNLNQELQNTNQNQSQSEIQKLKDALDDLKKSQQIKENDKRLKQERQSLTVQQTLTVQENPFKQGMLDASDKELPVHSHTNQKTSTFKQTKAKPYPNGENMSDLQRILQERAYLIESGEYEHNDPLIVELTRHIQELGGS